MGSSLSNASRLELGGYPHLRTSVTAINLALWPLGGTQVSDIELPPDPFLLESMRAVGYSFETAVADVIDNSIAANADDHSPAHIGGRARRESLSSTTVTGWTARQRSRDEAGGAESQRGPKESDLGRFGLGLKTASLSQCRRLTVATKQARPY